jgi:hypothetical protein
MYDFLRARPTNAPGASAHIFANSFPLFHAAPPCRLLQAPHLKALLASTTEVQLVLRHVGRAITPGQVACHP